MDLGTKIKNSRKGKGISAELLAHKIGKTKQALYNYENNRVIPKEDVLLSISKVLEVDFNDFLVVKKNVSPAMESQLQQLVEMIKNDKEVIIKTLQDELKLLKAVLFNLHPEMRKDFQNFNSATDSGKVIFVNFTNNTDSVAYGS